MANTTVGGDGLSAEEMGEVEVLLDRASDPMWLPPPDPRVYNYTGENLVWSLQLTIQRGILARNSTLVAECFQKMWPRL